MADLKGMKILALEKLPAIFWETKMLFGTALHIPYTPVIKHSTYHFKSYYFITPLKSLKALYTCSQSQALVVCLHFLKSSNQYSAPMSPNTVGNLNNVCNLQQCLETLEPLT